MTSPVQINRLRLSLPPEWRGKEQLVARALARELATLRVPRDLALDTLRVPPLTLRGGESWQSAVRRAAAGVQDQLATLSNGGPPAPPSTASPHA